jgi:hypothetical protein
MTATLEALKQDPQSLEIELQELSESITERAELVRELLEKTCRQIVADPNWAGEGYTSQRWRMRKMLRPEQLAVFDAAGLHSDEEITAELVRVNRVASHQAVAGTTADREVAKVAAVAAEKALADEGPAIEAKLAKLQQQLTDLKQTAHDAKWLVDRQQAACEKLRDFLPAWLQGEISRRRAAARAKLKGDELAAALAEATALQDYYAR